MVTPTSMSLKPNGTGGAGAGDRPRQGLGQSLASIVHGQGGNAPTCKLQDHPIQVRRVRAFGSRGVSGFLWRPWCERFSCRFFGGRSFWFVLRKTGREVESPCAFLCGTCSCCSSGCGCSHRGCGFGFGCRHSCRYYDIANFCC